MNRRFGLPVVAVCAVLSVAGPSARASADEPVLSVSDVSLGSSITTSTEGVVLDPQTGDLVAGALLSDGHGGSAGGTVAALDPSSGVVSHINLSAVSGWDAASDFPTKPSVDGDGNIWFSLTDSSALLWVHYAPSGATTAGLVPGASGTVTGVSADSSGDGVWFVDNSGKIGHATTTSSDVAECTPTTSSGGKTSDVVPNNVVDDGTSLDMSAVSSTIAIASLPSTINAGATCPVTIRVTPSQISGNDTPGGLALDPDGSLWFTDSSGSDLGDSHLVNVSTSGVVTSHSVSGSPTDLAVAADGSVYFTDWRHDSVGRLGSDGTLESAATPAADYGLGIGPSDTVFVNLLNKSDLGRVDMNAPAFTTSASLTESSSTTAYDQSVTFNIHVSSSDSFGAKPSGEVYLENDGHHLATVHLSLGLASYSTHSLSAGTHHIYASYLGPAEFMGSTSSTLKHDVTKASTSVHLKSNHNPLRHGQAGEITATVTVKKPGGGTPGGKLRFVVDGHKKHEVTLHHGKAALSLKHLTVGTHHVTAHYFGNSDRHDSTSARFTEHVKKK